MSQATQRKKKLSTTTIVIIALVAALVIAGVVYLFVRKDNRPMLEKIQDEKKIVVAMEGTWMPWTYHDKETNELTGFDYEVAKAVAAKLGVEAQFEECPWDSIFAGIGSRYDICVNGVDWSAERAENYTLSKPYVYNYPVLIVRTDSDITSFEDLKGKTTANTASSTYAALAESYGATNQPVDDLNQTLQLLIDNRIDATVNSADTFNEYMTNNPDAPLKIAARADSANSVVIVMPKGEKAATLEEAINKAIDELKQDGTLAALSVKYFDTDMTNAPEGSAQAN
ncbi:MAG: transporter substrate-binding domain-containing protein [Clostridia bacterium]|nr:transporter substrate-binding domain-containing protein [Clostridia bacterium]